MDASPALSILLERGIIQRKHSLIKQVRIMGLEDEGAELIDTGAASAKPAWGTQPDRGFSQELRLAVSYPYKGSRSAQHPHVH